MKRIQLLLLLVVMLLGAQTLRAAESYVVLSGTTLTFYCDNNKATRSGSKYALNKAGLAPSWAGKTAITKAVFDPSFANATPNNCTGWFYNLSGLKTIEGLQYLNTSGVTDMQFMFYNCTGLASVDLSHFNTANVTTMHYMFRGCSSLTKLDLSSFNTAKVTVMDCMFYDCSALTSVNVSSFNTANVTDIDYMFNNCSSLTALDLSNFTFTSSQKSDYMLQSAGLKKLTIPSTANNLSDNACNKVGSASAPCELSYPSGFTPAKSSTGNGYYVWKSGYFKDGTAPTPGTTKAYAVLSGSTLTFYDDASSGSRLGTVYDLNSGATAPAWSSKATTVTKVVFNSNFKSAAPTTTYGWFSNMTNLASITGLEYLNTSKVTNMASMFSGCTKLTSLNLSTFNTQNVTTMYRMFYNCSALKELQLYEYEMYLGEYAEYSTNFTTKKATNLQEMFAGCKVLKELVLAGFTFTSSTNSKNMLKGCSGLEELYFDQDMSALDYSACEGVGTPSEPCKLLNPRFMPEGSHEVELGEVYLWWKSGCFKDGLRVAFVVYEGESLEFYYGIRYIMGEMFELNSGSEAPEWSMYASNIKTVTFDESFKDATPTTMYAWFRNMSKLTTIEGLKNVNTEFVKNMDYMFSGCKSLKSLDLSGFSLSYVVASGISFIAQDICSTQYMLQNCSGLKSFTVPEWADEFDNTALKGVGTPSSPCTLLPSDFKPEDVTPGSGYFIWKSGYFTSGKRYLGDVNTDGSIDVTDAMCIVDYVLGKPLTKFSYINANMNGDSKVDIADAMMIVDYVLSK